MNQPNGQLIPPKPTIEIIKLRVSVNKRLEEIGPQAIN